MLRLPATARTGEYLAGLCCAVLLAIASEWKGEQVGSISGFYFVMLLFLFFLTPILLETHFVQIDISNGQIHARSPWRKSRSIPLSSVTSCTFSGSQQWYRIHTHNLGTVRMPAYMSGVETVLWQLPCKIPRSPIQFLDADGNWVHPHDSEVESPDDLT